MTAPDAEQAIAEFTGRLSDYARRNFEGGQAVHIHLSRAFSNGWTPKVLARHCSRELPARNAWSAIQSRLEWCANNCAPARALVAAEPVPWCGLCEDPSYRYLVDPETSEPLRPCPTCSPQRNQLVMPE